MKRLIIIVEGDTEKEFVDKVLAPYLWTKGLGRNFNPKSIRMKLTFDPDLKCQEQTIRSVTNLFEGQPLEPVINFGLREEGKLFHINSLSKQLIITENPLSICRI